MKRDLEQTHNNHHPHHPSKMRSAALLALLPILANAAAVERRNADSNVGSTTSDVFPPAGSKFIYSYRLLGLSS